MKRLTMLAAAAGLAAATAAVWAKPAGDAEAAPAKAPQSASAAGADVEPQTAAEKAAAERKARLERERQVREYYRVQRTLRARPRRGTQLEDVNLKNALQLLGEMGNFGVVFDPELEERGIDLNVHRVTLNLSGLSYERVLLLVLPAELGYRIGPGYVLITTLEKSWLPLRVASYSIRIVLAEVPDFEGPRMDVGELTSGGGGGSGGLAFEKLFGDVPAEHLDDEGRATPERVIDIILKHVRHENDRRIARWEDEGGPASIQYLQGRLIISQTPEGHRAVAEVLARLGA